jgi:hypothetical protein
MNKYSNQSPSVISAKASSDPFVVEIRAAYRLPGSKFRSFWSAQMTEVVTDVGVYMAEYDFTKYVGKRVEVTATKNDPDITWVRLNFKRVVSDHEQALLGKSKQIGDQTYFDLEDAISLNTEKTNCSVYMLRFGADSYVGFTTKDPEIRAAEHVDAAKSGASLPIHVAMRRWGYQYLQEILGSYDNELLGLLSEIACIERHRPTLNKHPGGSGNKFDIVTMPNEQSEEVFYFLDKKKILGGA